jgi:hypothetical protein
MWLARAARMVALAAFMPLVLFYLASGRLLASLLMLRAPPTAGPPPPPPQRPTTATTTAAPTTPPSARRMKRPRKQATPLLFAEGADDTAPDRPKAPWQRVQQQAPIAAATTTTAPPPPPRPPALALSADELRLLELRAPAELLCALDACVMRDAVVTPSGLSFERSCAERWLERWGCDPATSAPLTASQLYPNLAVRDRLVAWLEAEGRADAEAAAAAEAGGGVGGIKQAAATARRRSDVDAEID